MRICCYEIDKIYVMIVDWNEMFRMCEEWESLARTVEQMSSDLLRQDHLDHYRMKMNIKGQTEFEVEVIMREAILVYR
jgi:hypothetical protein